MSVLRTVRGLGGGGVLGARSEGKDVTCHRSHSRGARSGAWRRRAPPGPLLNHMAHPFSPQTTCDSQTCCPRTPRHRARVSHRDGGSPSPVTPVRPCHTAARQAGPGKVLACDFWLKSGQGRRQPQAGPRCGGCKRVCSGSFRVDTVLGVRLGSLTPPHFWPTPHPVNGKGERAWWQARARLTLFPSSASSLEWLAK